MDNLAQYHLLHYSELSAGCDYNAPKKASHGLFHSLSIIQLKMDDHILVRISILLY